MQFYKILGFVVGAAFLLFGISDGTVVFKEQSGGIALQCPNAGEWEKDGVSYAGKMDNGNLKLPRLSDTDTGEYTCINGQQRSSAFVFVKPSGNRSFAPHNNDLYQELANRRGSSEYSQLTPRLKI
ncbi:uncharacterized protein [Mobula birostris]|uniref:uncharacterized protein isoform X4 n=1 Tax=Mobula birostris TaxID=1983395 RepID=UPI003B28A93B